MSTVTDFNRTCTVNVNSVSQSATGAIIRGMAAQSTGVACAVQVVCASQRLQPESGETEYDVYTEWASPATILYGAMLTSITDMTNMTLKVISEPADDAGEQAYHRVRCQHVTGRNAPRE